MCIRDRALSSITDLKHCAFPLLRFNGLCPCRSRGAKHAVHGVGESLCILGAVWIVCGYASEVEAIPARPLFYGCYVRCHNVHLRSTLHKVVCLLYTSPSPRDRTRSRMPSSA